MNNYSFGYKHILQRKIVNFFMTQGLKSMIELQFILLPTDKIENRFIMIHKYKTYRYTTE